MAAVFLFYCARRLGIADLQIEAAYVTPNCGWLFVFEAVAAIARDIKKLFHSPVHERLVFEQARVRIFQGPEEFAT